MMQGEWTSAAVTLMLAFGGAFSSLLLAWFTQNQRINQMEGRLQEAEKGEKACLDRERALNLRVTELEMSVGKRASVRRRRTRK